MTLARAPWLASSVLVATVTFDCRAQTLVSTSGAALSIAAPTDVQYDANASGATGNYTITTTCTGPTSVGCRLFFQYGTNSQGQQMAIEYAVVSRSVRCLGVVANPAAWLPVVPTAVVLSTARNRSCVATFRFRASPLTYALYQSPGPPGGVYRQQIGFLFTRP